MLTVFTDIGLVALAVVVALTVAWVIGALVGRGGRRVLLLAQLSGRTRLPFRFFAAMLALIIALRERRSLEDLAEPLTAQGGGAPPQRHAPEPVPV